ncbi:hypothetical protein WDU94_010188 [Cyamophila willieti]
MALDKFYVHVAKYVNDNTRSSQSVAIYKYFMDYFDRELTAHSSLEGSANDTQSNLTIKGLSRFVECNVATSNETSRSHLATLFYSFLQRTLFLSLELSKLEPNRLESTARLVSSYLVLLSNLVLQLTATASTHVPGFSQNQVSTQTHRNSLLHISVNLVSVFPSLSYHCASQVAQNLRESLSGLCKKDEDYSAGGSWRTKFLQEFVYQSIIQTCSHNLVFDADILAQDSLITFRQYLPLWKHLLANSSANESPTHDGNSLSDLLLENLFTCLLLFCQKLDLAVHLKSDSELSKSTFLPSLSHTYLRDPCHHLAPSNSSDLTLFSNLVDFYTELLTKQISWLPLHTSPTEQQELPLHTSPTEQQELPLHTSPTEQDLSPNETTLLSPSTHPSQPASIDSCVITPVRLVSVLRQVIAASMHHPVVGGLYSLVALLLKLTTNAKCFEDIQLVEDLSPLLSTYLDQVISISLNQQQDLRYLCLSLLLVTPLCFIQLVIPHLVQPFKVN